MPGSACLKCGADLHPGDLFCGNCGATTGETAPLPPNNPIAVAQMPTVPPPVGVVEAVTEPDEHPGRRGGRLLAGIGVVVAFAAIAGLGLALLSTRDDLDNEKAKLAQIEAATTTSEPVPDAGAIGPVSPAGQDELIALQNQLDALNAALLQAKQDLVAEQDARSADAAAQSQQVADLQAQLTEMQALFPMTAAAIAAADPVGSFGVTLTAGECTLADCTALTTMTIQFTDATTVAGDRVKGASMFDGSQYTLGGSVDPPLAPTCAGQPADVSYSLALHVSAVDVADGKLRATRFIGTYTETIGGATATSAVCAGQHRTYTLDLVRQ